MLMVATQTALIGTANLYSIFVGEPLGRLVFDIAAGGLLLWIVINFRDIRSYNQLGKELVNDELFRSYSNVATTHAFYVTLACQPILIVVDSSLISLDATFSAVLSLVVSAVVFLVSLSFLDWRS